VIYLKIRFKKVKTLNEFIDAIMLRVDVFIKEQKFKPGWEPDEHDKKSTHFIAIVNKKIVATLRYREPKKDEIKFERMATKKEFRGKGISSKLLKFAIKNAKKRKPKKIWAISQERAKEFWEKNGFKAISKPYKIYGTKHLNMKFNE